MTQGDPLSPTIFNVVVEEVVRRKIYLVAEDEGGKDGWGRDVIHCAAIFYADYGLVTSTEPVWLQVSFDTLTSV